MNNKKRWDIFEKSFCEFLEVFLEELGFTFIKKPERQESGGPQYGRDINAEWHDGKFKYNWWFECKSHLKEGGNTINKKEYADKILEVLSQQHPPTCYCLVASERIFDKWFRRCQPLINSNIARTYIFSWTERNHIKDCLKFYPKLYKEIYHETPDLSGMNKKSIFNEVKRQIIENNDKAPEKLREPVHVRVFDESAKEYKMKQIPLNDPEVIETGRLIEKQLSRIKKR